MGSAKLQTLLIYRKWRALSPPYWNAFKACTNAVFYGENCEVRILLMKNSKPRSERQNRTRSGQIKSRFTSSSCQKLFLWRNSNCTLVFFKGKIVNGLSAYLYLTLSKDKSSAMRRCHLWFVNLAAVWVTLSITSILFCSLNEKKSSHLVNFYLCFDLVRTSCCDIICPSKLLCSN